MATMTVAALQPRAAWAAPVAFGPGPCLTQGAQEAASAPGCESSDIGSASVQLLSPKSLRRRNSWEFDKAVWGKLRAITGQSDSSCLPPACQKENTGNRRMLRSAGRSRRESSNVKQLYLDAMLANSQNKSSSAPKRLSVNRSSPALHQTGSEAADATEVVRPSSQGAVAKEIARVTIAAESLTRDPAAVNQQSHGVRSTTRPSSAMRCSLPSLYVVSGNAKDVAGTPAPTLSETYVLQGKPVLPTAIQRLTQEVGSNPQRRASSSGARPKSGQPKIRQETANSRDYEDRFVQQLTALEALLEQLSINKPMEIVASSILSAVLTRESSQAYAPGHVSHVVKQVLLGRGLAAAEAAVAVSRLLSGSPELSNQSRAVQLLQMLQVFKPLTTVDACGLIGQILWQHRHVECLQLKPHREVVEDLSWITEPNDAAGPLGSIEKTFQDLTIVDGGRMDFRQWQKAVQLLYKCPELEAAVPRQEANRLFYACFRHNSQANRTIGCKEFVKLLLEFASAGGVHPFLVFRTIHSHVGRAAFVRQPP